jgi:FkbM family methyltransferase
MNLKALFYPDVPFDSLFIPYIYREIYLEGIYQNLVDNFDDMVVVDVGANIGVVTQYLRDYSKKLYAIEPSTEHFEALKKNKEFNKWDNVEVFNIAVADKDGEMTLNRNDNNRTCHSLTLNYGQGGEKVKTMAMDSFIKKNKIKEVDFMKFDVEGAEDLILRSEGFAKVAPKIKRIMVEFHHPTWMELVKYMETLGYTATRYESSAIIVLFSRE